MIFSSSVSSASVSHQPSMYDSPKPIERLAEDAAVKARVVDGDVARARATDVDAGVLEQLADQGLSGGHGLVSHGRRRRASTC